MAARMPREAGGQTATVGPDRTTVVLITRDRRASLLRSLGHLRSLPERPPIVVVDNGSSDDTVRAVAAAWPDVHVVALPDNLGATARTIGVLAATTPYVAFADDDSWWDPGSLDEAADALDAHPDVGVVVARVLVGPDGRDDPLNEVLARSAGDDRREPGRDVAGFLACAAVVRCADYLAVGGFDDLLFFFGEEQLLAIDLADTAHRCCYVDRVVARHHPDAERPTAARRCRALRNATLTAWMRRPLRVALHRSLALGRAALHDGAARRAMVETGRRLPAALERRRRPRPRTEALVGRCVADT